MSEANRQLIRSFAGSIDVGAFYNAPPASYPALSPDSMFDSDAVGSARSWEAADTNRLNEAHWLDVSDNMVEALLHDLPTLQQRCRHETFNNPVIDAGIDTHATNVVGERGPRLQIQTDNDRFNTLVESLWNAWADECEYQDGLPLIELLSGWVGQWQYNGEIFVQEIVGSGGVRDYKLHDLGAECLDWTKQGDRLYGGVEVDDKQRVIKYHVHDPETMSNKQTINREFAIHCYRRRLAMQRRGIPALTSSLPTSADTRDYDDQVMDAARSAADYSIIMTTDHPDAQLRDPVKPHVPLRRRMRHYAIPGWKVNELRGNQPAVTYESFRKQKHTDIAGTMGEMPHMIFRRDASNHNMSSARFDGSRYAKAVSRFQRMLAIRILNHIVRRLVRIGQRQKLLPATPMTAAMRKIAAEFPNAAIPIVWTWPKPPPVDQLKASMAERMDLENGSTSLSQVISERGELPEEVIAQRARDNADLIAAGLPPIDGALPPVSQAAVAMATQPDEPPPNDQPSDPSADQPEAPAKLGLSNA